MGNPSKYVWIRGCGEAGGDATKHSACVAETLLQPVPPRRRVVPCCPERHVHERRRHWWHRSLVHLGMWRHRWDDLEVRFARSEACDGGIRGVGQRGVWRETDPPFQCFAVVISAWCGVLTL